MPKKKGKTSQCPPSVERLINAANSLPANFQVPFERQTFESIQKEQAESIERKKAKFYETLRAVPKDFINHHPKLKAFLDGKTVDESYDFNFLRKSKAEIKDWYERWCENENTSTLFSPLHELKSVISNAKNTRRELMKVVEYGNQFIAQNQPTTYPGIYTSPGVVLTSPRNFPLQVKTDEIHYFGLQIVDGVFEIQLGAVFSVFINENVDVRRIKHCQNCQIFFWVKRLNKDIGQNMICEKCSNAIRQKRFAKNNPEKVKKDKRARYIKNNPNSKVALLEKKEMEKQAEWRKRRDRDFSKKD